MKGLGIMKWYVWLSLLVITVATAARADTYYVATNGSDENPGSETKPLRTVQKAASLARVGDMILVRGGVYHEAFVLRFSGQQGKPIVLKNYAGESGKNAGVIQPGELGKQPPGHSILLQAQQGYQKPIGWITVEGLEIRYGWDGVKFYNAHDIIIRRCNIHQNWNQGILGNGNRVLIDRNIIAGKGTNKKVAQNLVHGIYATGTAYSYLKKAGLLIYHSVKGYGGHLVYRGGVALLDKYKPYKVIARSREWMFQAEAPYELSGLTTNVVFPTGLLLRGDELWM